eukprot:12396215-Alexandrium_andersonii.AAC.1
MSKGAPKWPIDEVVKMIAVVMLILCFKESLSNWMLSRWMFSKVLMRWHWMLRKWLFMPRGEDDANQDCERSCHGGKETPSAAIAGRQPRC